MWVSPHLFSCVFLVHKRPIIFHFFPPIHMLTCFYNVFHRVFFCIQNCIGVLWFAVHVFGRTFGLCVKFTSSFMYIIRTLIRLVSFFTTYITWWHTNTLHYSVTDFTAIVASWFLRHNVPKVFQRCFYLSEYKFFNFYCISKIEKLIHYVVNLPTN